MPSAVSYSLLTLPMAAIPLGSGGAFAAGVGLFGVAT